MGFEIDGLDDFISRLKKLEEPAEIAKKCVDAAAPALETKLASAVSAAASRGYSQGDLAASIGATEAKENEYGVFAAVRPTGTDRKGVRNATKLGILHYGSSRQPPTGCMTKAVTSAEQECLGIMQRKFDEEVQGL